MSRLLTLLIVTLMVAAVAATGQQTVDFRGRVIDADTNGGIENLEVKFTPPRGATAAIRVVTTDRNGEFAFPRLLRVRYLVQVSQGVNLLYRAELDATTADRLDVRLRRKR